MSNQLFVDMNVKFLVKGITPADFWTSFHQFLEENTELVSQSGRKQVITIMESSFSSIVQFDEDDNEREFLDVKGNLIAQ